MARLYGLEVPPITTGDDERRSSDHMRSLGRFTDGLVCLGSQNPQDITWNNNSVREAILTILGEISQSRLSKLCGIPQPTISSIVNNKYETKLSQIRCEEFGKWFEQYQGSKPEEAAVVIESEEAPQANTLKSSEGARLTFHSKLEVPQLKEWFEQNRSPSDRMLTYYAEVLNQGSVRAERTKVTVKSLKNWWKNYKQKQRNEMKAMNVKDSKSTRKNKKN